MILEIASMLEPIIKTLSVGADATEAFRFFTGNFGTWWPVHDPKYTGDNAASVDMEARKGGRIFATYKDGRESTWGVITEFKPGERVTFSWGTPVSEGAPNKDATYVTVEFADGGDGTSTVTLTHSGWERLPRDAEETRHDYDEGWDHVLGDCFAPFVAKA